MSEDATWREADLILDRLLNAPDSERDDELARLNIAPAVRDRAQQLLAAHRRQRGVLEQPFCESVALNALSGRRLGRWVLEQEIGRGGMAVVYRARSVEAPAGQAAALKVLTVGALAGDGVRRFREEQQILARLRHPHIAALIDSGVSEDGTPWFAMALVEGQRIDNWCRTRGLGIREQVRLFLDVCAAVEYAHRSLIIHRDLKPSNVLVDGEGHVRLLDFGIARLADTDGTERTLTQSRVLTPQYAAPEQLGGAPPSTSMDVYGLGALLYTMLTGRSPRDLSADPQATPTLPSLAVATGGDPTATGIDRARREIRGDLDAILLKALAGEVELRYVSVAALQADLTRWLNGLPVEARVPSLRYRLGKFIRRNRLGMSASLAIVLALGAGAIGTLWQSARAREEAARALAEAQRADAVRDFLVELFRANDPDSTGGKTPDLLSILAKGAERAERADALPLRARAELLSTIGSIYANLGRYAEAEPLLDRGIALWKADPSIADPERFKPRLARVALLTSQGKTQKAIEEGKAVVDEIRASKDPPPSLVASALVRLVETKAVAGAVDASTRAESASAVALTRQLIPPDTLALGHALHNQAMVELDLDALPSAETAARESIKNYEAAGAEGLHALRASLMTLGRILSDQNRHADALEVYARGVQITRDTYGADHVYLARALNSYAVELNTNGKFAEAIGMLNESIAIQRKALGDTPRLAPSLFNLAFAQESLAEYAQAVDNLGEALRLQQSEHGASDARVLQIMGNLARVRTEMGQVDAARTLFDEIDARLSALPKKVSNRTEAETALKLASFQLMEGHPESALQWIEQAQAVLAKGIRNLDVLALKADLLLAEAQYRSGNAAAARPTWDRALGQLRGMAPELRYYFYEQHLTAARFALRLGDGSTAAQLLAVSEAALVDHPMAPRFAVDRAELLAAAKGWEGDRRNNSAPEPGAH